MVNTFADYARVRNVTSRSINGENLSGAKGAAGDASSVLGRGRKGRPCLKVGTGETLTLAEISGAGVIRHIWMTVPDRTESGPYVLSDLVLRGYWDGEQSPSLEVPLGDFFCNGFATRALVTSVPIVVAPTGGMNCYFQMPFRKGARLTLTNEHKSDIDTVFFQIDYTIEGSIPDDVGYFHAQWRRSAGTAPAGTDHVIVDGVTGSGTYVGTYIALTALQRWWWGEGELKFFIDGDDELPTIAGTGLEDYAGGAWGFQDHLGATPEPEVINFSAPYFGYPYRGTADTTAWSPYATAALPRHGLYRWHLPDPIHFASNLKVTLQQIGDSGHGLFERVDDICTTAYWYQHGPHAVFPALPAAAARHPR